MMFFWFVGFLWKNMLMDNQWAIHGWSRSEQGCNFEMSAAYNASGIVNGDVMWGPYLFNDPSHVWVKSQVIYQSVHAGHEGQLSGNWPWSAFYLPSPTSNTHIYIYVCVYVYNCIYTSGGTKWKLLESLTKHPSRPTADHISKSISRGRCGTVNYHPLLNL